jgi:O-antigen ligase
MANNPQFSDYEPIIRPKGLRNRHVVDESEGELGSTRKNPEGEFKLSPALSQFVLPEKKHEEAASTPAEHSARESWVKKRGHSFSFAGLLLFTFLVFFRPYEWSPSLEWLSSSAFLTAILTLGIFVPVQLGLEGTLTSRPREVNLVLLLLVLAALSVPFATDRLQAWNSFVEYIKVVIIFIVMVNVMRTETRLKTTIFVVLIASCVLSIAALKDFEAGKLALRGQRIEGAIGGLFQNPNDLALHLVTTIPIALALMLASKRIVMKVLYGIVLPLSVVGVVLTFSRGGFLGLMAATGVFAWRLPRRNKFLIPLVLSPIFLAVILFAPGGYGSRLSTTNDDSAAARTDELKRSLYIAARHPVLGVGIGDYVLYSNRDQATHNAYTQVASECGLTAAVLYLLFLISPIKGLRKIAKQTENYRRRPPFYYLAIGLEASLIGYMVSSFFASVAFLWYAYYLVAYAICIRRLYALEEGKNSDGLANNRKSTTNSTYSIPISQES